MIESNSQNKRQFGTSPPSYRHPCSWQLEGQVLRAHRNICWDLHPQGWPCPIVGSAAGGGQSPGPNPNTGCPTVLLSHSGPQSSHPWNADRNARQVSTHRALQALPREGLGQSRGYGMVLPPVSGICTQNTHQKRNSISRVIIFN